jgi:flagellar protein FlaG
MTGQIARAVLPASSIGVNRPTPMPGRQTAGPPPAPASVTLPPGGKTSPPPAAQDLHIDVEKSRAALERFARTVRRELEFRVDEESGRTIITVRNKETGEIVRQIPAEEVLAMAHAVAEGGAVLLDSTA